MKAPSSTWDSGPFVLWRRGGGQTFCAGGCQMICSTQTRGAFKLFPTRTHADDPQVASEADVPPWGVDALPAPEAHESQRERREAATDAPEKHSRIHPSVPTAAQPLRPARRAGEHRRHERDER